MEPSLNSSRLRRIRTDQVGSLLRPRALLEARANWRAGRLHEAALVQLEDEAILSALDAQAATHQDIFVDGEFRRTGFMTGFPESCEGFVEDTFAPIEWKGGTGTEGPSPNTQLVIGKRLSAKRRIAKNEADFLKTHAPGPFSISVSMRSDSFMAGVTLLQGCSAARPITHGTAVLKAMNTYSDALGFPSATAFTNTIVPTNTKMLTAQPSQ